MNLSDILDNLLKEKKEELTHKEKLKYAIYVLKNNIFNKNEVDYYIGKTDKSPHGIEPEIWRKAYKIVGKISVKGE